MKIWGGILTVFFFFFFFLSGRYYSTAVDGCTALELHQSPPMSIVSPRIRGPDPGVIYIWDGLVRRAAVEFFLPKY